MAGLEAHVVSKKRKSEMFGAQYLHRPIPEISEDEPFHVNYIMQGEFSVYREKVYGKDFRGVVSPEEFAGNDHLGWNIRSAYDTLWTRWQDKINDVNFTNSQQVAGLIAEAMEKGYAHIISTMPAPYLCIDPAHGFSGQDVWAIGDAPERGIFSPIVSDLNTVVCSGWWEESWYRKSNILGYNSVEWPANKKVPIEGVAKITKPLATNCTCWPNVHRLGRYGKWTKGALSHEAFYETFLGLAPERALELPE